MEYGRKEENRRQNASHGPNLPRSPHRPRAFRAFRIKFPGQSTDLPIEVGKSGATILGLAALAGAVFYIGQSYLDPATERAEQEQTVLTGALDPVVEFAEILEDAALPEGIEPPTVGDDIRYVRVSILYPDRIKAPEARSHLLAQAGAGAFVADPAHATTSVDEDGARVVVVYQVDSRFEWGRIECDDKTIIERFELD